MILQATFLQYYLKNDFSYCVKSGVHQNHNRMNSLIRIAQIIENLCVDKRPLNYLLHFMSELIFVNIPTVMNIWYNKNVQQSASDSCRINISFCVSLFVHGSYQLILLVPNNYIAQRFYVPHICSSRSYQTHNSTQCYCSWRQALKPSRLQASYI